MLLKIHSVSKSHNKLLIFCPIMEDCAFYVEAIILGIHSMTQIYIRLLAWDTH